MGRSVAVPGNAEVVVFFPHNCEDQDEFDWLVEDLQVIISKRYPRFEPANIWVGRELRAILANDHADVVVAVD